MSSTPTGPDRRARLREHFVRPIKRSLAGLMLLLAGCSVGPRYHRADVALPAAWNTSPAGYAWPSSDWWVGFNSDELNTLIDRAQRANDDLAAAMARVEQADAQVRIAGAALFPAVGGTADASRSRTITANGPVTATQYSVGLAASYELDLWGKNRAKRRAAAETAMASRFDRQTVQLMVMSGVATTYFQFLEAHDRAAVARQNLAAAQTTLRGLKLEEIVGTATALDVAQQETTVAALAASIPPLDQQARQAVDALAILVGEQPESLHLAESSLTNIEQPVVGAGLPSELLTRRPDVAEAEAKLRAANANITVARAAFFPDITLTADGGFVSGALSTLFDPSHRIFDLSAGLTQPLFEGGALSGQLAFTKAQYRELLADYHKAVISAFANTEDALVAAQQSSEQQRLQQESVATSQRAYDIAQAQLRAGTTNILTVLNTENALFTAQDSLIQVRFAHLQALVSLFNALGGGWQQTKGA